MIKALIFDCYGVLTTDAWAPFKDKHFGGHPDKFDEASSLNQQTNAGLISYQDFLEKVGALAGMSATDVARAIDNNVPNESLFALIKQLKPRYKLGILSNAASDSLPGLFEVEQRGLFDATALSYEMRTIKPDARAYEIIADRLGMEPSECVFIDDQERFCTGAREAGMQAVWYRDFAQCRADLTKLGVLV